MPSLVNDAIIHQNHMVLNNSPHWSLLRLHAGEHIKLFVLENGRKTSLSSRELLERRFRVSYLLRSRIKILL